MNPDTVKPDKVKSANTKPGALLFCDLDYFKKINDEHGHEAGDVCLQRNPPPTPYIAANSHQVICLHPTQAEHFDEASPQLASVTA